MANVTGKTTETGRRGNGGESEKGEMGLEVIAAIEIFMIDGSKMKKGGGGGGGGVQTINLSTQSPVTGSQQTLRVREGRWAWEFPQPQ